MADVMVRQKAGTRDLASQSAGTATWHVGEPMDPRAASALTTRGYDPSSHVAQHASQALLAQHDLVIAIDRKHREILSRQVDSTTSTLVLLRTFDPQHGGASDIDDPYYGDDAGFEQCAALIERSVDGLLEAIDLGLL